MTMPNGTTEPDAAAAAAASADADDAAATATETDAEPTGAESLGDSGKKALDEMKSKWHSERDRRKALEAEVDKLKTPKPAEGEQPTIEQLREQARSEAQAETLRERALDKIEAKAARLVKDPTLAAAMLRDKVDEFVDGGKIDADAIAEALDALVKQYPYLGVTQGEPSVAQQPRFSGGSDAGPKGTPGKPQITKAQLAELYQQKKYGEIAQLRNEGRMNAILGIT